MPLDWNLILFKVIPSFDSINARVNELEDDVHFLLSLNEKSERRLKLQ